MSTQTKAKLEWTPEMDEYLASHTLLQTAARFGTNLSACYKRSKKLGHARVNGGTTRAVKWSPDQDEVVRAKSLKEAMGALGRPEWQVIRRRKELGIGIRKPRKRSTVMAALRRADYNVAAAARSLGISPQRMHQLLDKFRKADESPKLRRSADLHKCGG